MKIGNQLKLGSAILIFLLGISLSCTRNISVSPTVPSIGIVVASSTPTLTPTNSPTATAQFTSTNTATQTPTNTPLNTATNTPTATPTNTNAGGFTSTFTASFTPSNTPTITPTSTVTNTPTLTDSPTPSATPTNTAAGCSPSYQATYTFPSDTMCWSAWGSIGGNAVSPTLAETGSLAPPAGNAITTVLNFTTGNDTTWTSGDSEYVIVGMQFATPVPSIPANTVISFYYQCPGNTTTTSGQLLLNGATGSTTGGALGSWVNTLNTTWSQCAMTLTSAATGVTQIGMQFLYGGAAANYATTGPITVDIAAVSIFTLSGCVTEFTYADGTGDGWAETYPTAGALGVTNVSAFPPTGASNTYALLIPWVGSTTVNDLQSEIDGGSVITPYSNWVSNNITSVKFQYWVDPAFGNYNFTVAPYVIANGNHYGGTYESSSAGWYDTCNGTCSYVASGTWLTANLTPSGGTWTTDEAAGVTAVGVDINISASMQDTSGNFIVDNVCLY